MTRYDNTPNHPLAGVPQPALDAARAGLTEVLRDLDRNDPSDVEAAADSIVAHIARTGHIRLRPHREPANTTHPVLAALDDVEAGLTRLHGGDTLGAYRAELNAIDALCEEVRNLNNNGLHKIQWAPSGEVTAQHPLSCRPNLLGCPILDLLFEAARDNPTILPTSPGTYLATIEGDPPRATLLDAVED